MRIVGRFVAGAVVGAMVAVAVPAAAQGSPVLRVARDGSARVVKDRFLPPRKVTALPAVPEGSRIAAPPRARASAVPTLSASARARYDAALADARRVGDLLAGAQRAEMAGVVATAEGIEARGQLTESRVNALVLTLERNTQFWPANQPPAAGTRVVFSGSPVILEYYAGSGLQIQPLANFGKANAHWNTCNKRGDRTCTPLRELLDAMLALTSSRGGFSTWEYFFEFEGGAPPWMSGMAQGTAMQSLSRAYQMTRQARYRDAAVAARPAFETHWPTGVSRPAANGTHYLIYSYAPDLFVFNGFLQALIGLDAYRNVTGDSRATTLFNSGDSHGRWLVPYSDTGSWSRYSLNGPESTLEYHVLLRDFLKNLCNRVGVTVYCDTANRFTAYLAARPEG